jgi:hypothetical protein
VFAIPLYHHHALRCRAHRAAVPAASQRLAFVTILPFGGTGPSAGLLPPSSRQKYFLACSPVPSSSGTRPPTLLEDDGMYYVYVYISKSDMFVVHVIAARYTATLPTSATATGTCLRNHPLVRSNRFFCWAAPVKFSSEILPRLLSGTHLPLQVLAPPRCQKTMVCTMYICRNSYIYIYIYIYIHIKI